MRRIFNLPTMNKYDQILMQYETPLPDDFDMDQVRSRVRKLAPQFDHYHGLGFKLYGVNDTKQAAVNEYTSIYLWNNPDPMRGFLAGDLFENYSQVFARPSVRSWLVHEIFGNILSVADAHYSLRRTISIPRQMKWYDLPQSMDFGHILFAGSRFSSGKGYRRSVSQNRAW